MNKEEAMEIFGIKRIPSEIEIKKRHKELMKKHHPDINDSENAKQEAQKINEAKEFLLKFASTTYADLDDLDPFDIFKNKRRENIDPQTRFWISFLNGKDTDYFKKLHFFFGSMIMSIELAFFNNEFYDSYVNKAKAICKDKFLKYYLTQIEQKKISAIHQEHIVNIIENSPMNLETMINLINNEIKQFKEYEILINEASSKPVNERILIDNRSFRESLHYDLIQNKKNVLLENYPTIKNKEELNSYMSTLDNFFQQNMSFSYLFFMELEDFLNISEINNEGKNLVFSKLKENVLMVYDNFLSNLNSEKFSIKYYKKLLIKNGYKIKFPREDIIDIKNILEEYKDKLDLNNELLKNLFINLESYSKEFELTEDESSFDEFLNKCFKKFKDLELEFLNEKANGLTKEDIGKIYPVESLYLSNDIEYYFAYLNNFSQVLETYMKEVYNSHKQYIYNSLTKDISLPVPPAIWFVISDCVEKKYEIFVKDFIKKNGDSLENNIKNTEFNSYINTLKIQLMTVFSLVLNFLYKINNDNILKDYQTDIIDEMNNLLRANLLDLKEDDLIKLMNDLELFYNEMKIKYSKSRK